MLCYVLTEKARIFCSYFANITTLTLTVIKEQSVHTKPRPVHLDLTRMTFPPMAIVSILHRISGVLLFLLLPLALFLLHDSLHSQLSFAQFQAMLALPEIKCLLWVMISAVSFHFFAGVRHMLMDYGIAEGLQTARITAYSVFVLTALATVAAGVWLW